LRSVAPDKLRLTSRDTRKLADFFSRGHQTVTADFADRQSMDKAFSGVTTVLLISGDGPNEVRMRQHRSAIDAAKSAGVQRIVYTSFANPTRTSLFPFAWAHADTEEYLMSCGLSYTILRNNHYAENINGAIAHAKQTGILSLPSAYGRVAYITRSDAAEVAASALTGSGHDNRVYEITGPEAVDLFDIAAVLSQTWNRRIEASEMAPETFAQVLTGFGVEDFALQPVVLSRVAASVGEYAVVSQDAAHITGRPMLSMRDYVRGH
jgi:NAD(P)H dehydrogenase (quinone)